LNGILINGFFVWLQEDRGEMEEEEGKEYLNAGADFDYRSRRGR
jgi:hypothetical protein